MGKPVAKTNGKTNGKPAGKGNTALALVPMGGQRKPLVKPTVSGCNYVQFLNVKSPKRMEVCDKLKIKASRLQDDAPCLHTVDGPELLDPFKFFLTACFFQYFAVVDEKYVILDAVKDVDEAPGGDFQEFMETICVIITPGGELVPACITFKGPKASAFHSFQTAIEEKGKGDTDGPGVYSGLVGTGSLREYHTKRSNRDIMLLDMDFDETDAKLAKKLADRFTNAEFVAALEDCVRTMKDRLATVDSKCS